MIYVTINGTEVKTTGIEISNELTHTPDTCSFVLHNPDTAPSAGQVVICRLDTSTGTVLFAGTIISTNQVKLAPHETPALRYYSYQVDCQDYTHLLNQRLVINAYVSKNSKEIIADIVTNFTDAAHGFTTTNVSTSRTITRIVFDYIPVVEAITQLADLLLWDWYVDSDKDIHFFERETISAPFLIDDTAVTTKINNFNITPDYTQLRNRCYVRGGTYKSDYITQSIVADGQARFWTLAYEMSDFTMTIGGAPVTSAVDFLYPDDGTYAYYWNSGEKYVRCGDFTPTATPAIGSVMAFTYKYKVPVIVRADNLASQTAIAAIEGGDGIYESIIRDDTIDNTTTAHDRANAEVIQYGDCQITGGFTTYESGFKAGQFVDISVSGYTALHGNYQIQRVVINAASPDDEFYQITFASTLYELKDFLLGLIRAQSRLKLREDEIVDILKIVNENITITESHAISKTPHPVKWDEFLWSMATWG